MVPLHTNLAEPASFFRFAVTTTLVSVIVLTAIAAILVAVNMPETFDAANTKAEHWRAVGIVGYFGLLLSLPCAGAVWLLGLPVFKGAMLLKRSPVFAAAFVGSLSWFVLFGWLAWESQSASLLSPIIFGAVISWAIAHIMTGSA